MAKETQNWLTFPAPSMYDRLSEIKSHGFSSIRAPYFWEAYVKNPTAFVAGLNEISSTADKLSLCGVYDFHQHYWSSYLEHGDGGFLSFLTKSYSADRTGELKFWDDYYHNNIIYNGVHVWDLQSNFVRDGVLKNVDSYPSTCGYDLLNEPIIQTCSQFADVGNTQTYIGSKIRAATAKPIFF